MKTKLLLGCVLLGCSTAPNIKNQAIVGGVLDSGHAYVVGIGDNSGAFCSGTLISRRTVLTAGHCAGGITRVIFGDVLSGQVDSIPVVRTVLHPGFALIGSDDATNDLALLELAFEASVQPAPLLRETMQNSAAFIGPDYTFVGFGFTGPQDFDSFGRKRVATFPITLIGPAEVGGSFGSIDDTTFYYESNGQSACFGDSGGPAFLVRNRVERHAGATSSGDEGCAFDGNQARTDNPFIEDFIQPNLALFEGDDPCSNNGLCDESCNAHKALVDPDCAEDHCGPDGMCVLSCVAPLDPDCASSGVNHCLADGVCDPSCNNLDDDCLALCASEGTCIPGCQSPDPDCGGGCGDGILEPNEACDDGNALNGDGCEVDCSLSCGDGVLGANEECDDGNALENDGCHNNCVLAFCGDGVVNAGEECDDLNHNPNDGCLECLRAFCGDGFVQEDVEVCDDGNLENNDACRTSCQPARCGDGLLDDGEECDDGNRVANDGCSGVCRVEVSEAGCMVAPSQGSSLWWSVFGLFIGLGCVRRQSASK